MAVQTPIGLMVPVVRDADTKGLAQIAAEVKQLAAKVGKPPKVAFGVDVRDLCEMYWHRARGAAV